MGSTMLLFQDVIDVLYSPDERYAALGEAQIVNVYSLNRRRFGPH